MNSLPDPLRLNELPGWSQQRQSIKPMVQPVVTQGKWPSVGVAIATGFTALFIGQFLLAVASADLKGYRARALDIASFASVPVAFSVGFSIWKRGKNV